MTTLRARAMLMTLVLDEVDEHGNVINELTAQPVRVFPVQWADLPAYVEAQIQEMNAKRQAPIVAGERAT